MMLRQILTRRVPPVHTHAQQFNVSYGRLSMIARAMSTSEAKENVAHAATATAFTPNTKTPSTQPNAATTTSATADNTTAASSVPSNAASTSSTSTASTSSQSTRARSSRRPPPPPTHPIRAPGSPPSAGHFMRYGLPFMLFMVLGSWGWAQMLQPAMDQQGSSARNSLYGQKSVDVDGLKKPYEKMKPQSERNKPKMRTLEEEYIRAQKDWLDDYQLKPVPRPPNAPNVQ